ncbi:hypothetical protein ACFFX0_13225 [Citricoccus parietis]|uniref:Uncharacterized protein n=1 Tax=Citricoccus parietis TaxID=592307 RepID=A0ABV5FZK8_9MICC
MTATWPTWAGSAPRSSRIWTRSTGSSGIRHWRTTSPGPPDGPQPA